MITKITIKPEKYVDMPSEYEFSEQRDGVKNWFNVTLHQGQKSYVLGSVISGNGFIPCEGAVVRRQLMEVLSAFYELNIKITANSI